MKNVMTKKIVKLYLNHNGYSVKGISHIEKGVDYDTNLYDYFHITFNQYNQLHKNDYESVVIYEEEVQKFIKIFLREKKLERLLTESEE